MNQFLTFFEIQVHRKSTEYGEMQEGDMRRLCLEDAARFAPYNIAMAQRLHDGPHHFNKVFLRWSIWLIKWLLAKPASPLAPAGKHS
jgi:hypothetical protein